MRFNWMGFGLLALATSSAHAAVQVQYIDEVCRSNEVRSCIQECTCITSGTCFNQRCADLQQIYRTVGQFQNICDMPLNTAVARNCQRTVTYTDAADLQAQLAQTRDLLRTDVVNKIEETRKDFIREVNQVFERVTGGEK